MMTNKNKIMGLWGCLEASFGYLHFTIHIFYYLDYGRNALLNE